jgi:hypothetical protein
MRSIPGQMVTSRTIHQPQIPDGVQLPVSLLTAFYMQRGGSAPPLRGAKSPKGASRSKLARQDLVTGRLKMASAVFGIEKGDDRNEFVAISVDTMTWRLSKQNQE